MTRTTLLRAAAALIALLGLARPALAIEHIPYTDKDGLIEVQASVDGRDPVPMLVDLGAGVDILSEAMASRYLILGAGKYTTLRITGQRVDLPVGTVVSLAFGEHRVENPRMSVWKGLDGTGVDGLISALDFRNVATTFDFSGKQLVIEDQQSFAERKRTASRVPVMLQDERGVALGVFAWFDFGNGASGLCEIDTGTLGIRIDNSYAQKLGVNLADPSLKRTQTPAGVATAATIPEFTMRAAPQTRLVRPEVSFENLIYDCVVGNRFWNGRTFTLDIPDGAIFVQGA